MKDIIRIRTVNKSDYEFLYFLLAERNPKSNISHNKMPTYTQHVKFIKSNPYSKWYIIYYNNNKIGTTYLSKINEIAIHLKKDIKIKQIESKVLYLIMDKNPRGRYLANVSPRNRNCIKFFKNHGFKLIQHTYELVPNENAKTK